MSNYFRAQAERFWHVQILEYNLGLGFNPEIAAIIAATGLAEEMRNARRS